MPNKEARHVILYIPYGREHKHAQVPKQPLSALSMYHVNKACNMEIK